MNVEDFLSDDGTDIRFAKLLTATLGGVFLGIASGISEITTRVLTIPSDFLTEFGVFLARIVSLLIDVPRLAITGSAGEAIALVEGAGPVAFALSLGIVLAMLYVVAEVVSRVRE